MSPEDKTTLYWTGGITLGLAIVVAVIGLYFGWFEAGVAPGG